MEKFTKKEAVNIQRNDLLLWKKVVNDEAYSKLNKWCKAGNRKVKEGPNAGYKIRRGIDLTDFITNLKYEI